MTSHEIPLLVIHLYATFWPILQFSLEIVSRASCAIIADKYNITYFHMVTRDKCMGENNIITGVVCL